MKTKSIIAIIITTLFLILVPLAFAKVEMTASVPSNEVNECVKILKEAGYIK